MLAALWWTKRPATNATLRNLEACAAWQSCLAHAPIVWRLDHFSFLFPHFINGTLQLSASEDWPRCKATGNPGSRAIYHVDFSQKNHKLQDQLGVAGVLMLKTSLPWCFIARLQVFHITVLSLSLGTMSCKRLTQLAQCPMALGKLVEQSWQRLKVAKPTSTSARISFRFSEPPEYELKRYKSLRKRVVDISKPADPDTFWPSCCSKTFWIVLSSSNHPNAVLTLLSQMNISANETILPGRPGNSGLSTPKHTI